MTHWNSLPDSHFDDRSTATVTCPGGDATVASVGSERATQSQTSSWRFFYLPMIIGLAVGAGLASATDQWWWVAVGAVGGAAIGGAARLWRSTR